MLVADVALLVAAVAPLLVAAAAFCRQKGRNQRQNLSMDHFETMKNLVHMIYLLFKRSGKRSQCVFQAMYCILTGSINCNFINHLAHGIKSFCSHLF